MKVYFISGLGADKSVFQLLELGYCEPVFLDWINPLPNEPLPAYALRLAAHYRIPSDAIIVGLSFGGMLATEIAKAFPKTKVVLLSSSKTKNEIPAFYKLGKYLPMYKWVPDKLQFWVMLIQEKRFSLRSDRGKKVYRQMIEQTDISFNKWAIWALLHWQNTTVPPNITHIHGTADKILPYTSADITIPNGGHLMVIENAVEVSAVLRRVLFG